MKLTKKQTLGLIKKAIINKKSDVILALKKASISVPEGTTNSQLLDIVMANIEEGNGYFIYYLSQVIVQDLKKQAKETSNANGTTTTTTNWGGMGTSVIEGIGGFIVSSNNLKIAQIQADAAKAKAEADKELAKIGGYIYQPPSNNSGGAKDMSTIIIVSVIGGVLLLGTIITVVLLKKK